MGTKTGGTGSAEGMEKKGVIHPSVTPDSPSCPSPDFKSKEAGDGAEKESKRLDDDLTGRLARKAN